MFLCQRQLCTAVLECAREEECTCQRITEEQPYPPLKTHPLNKIYTPWCTNAALISIPLSSEYPVLNFPWNNSVFLHKHLITSNWQPNQQYDMMWKKFQLLRLTWKEQIFFYGLRTFLPHSALHHLQFTLVFPINKRLLDRQPKKSDTSAGYSIKYNNVFHSLRLPTDEMVST